MSLLVTITVVQSSMQFFTKVLFETDRILRNNGLFSSLNNFKRLYRHNFFNFSHFLTTAICL